VIAPDHRPMAPSVPEHIPRLLTGWMHEACGQLHILLHPQQPRWVAVNSLGWEVAQLCDGQHTVDDIAAAIATRYGQEAETVRRDVETYLTQLRQAGLLEETPPSPAPSNHPSLTHLHLYLTDNCNLRCVHCAVTDGARRTDRLSTAQAFQLIDELVAAGARSIALTGGEPLLRPDALRIVEYAAARLHTLVSTNGTLITERIAETLVHLGVPVQVSLDGATAVTHDRIRGPGAFERAWRGIDLLLRRGVGDRLALCLTLMKWNLHQVPALVALAEARGVAGVRILPLQRLGRAAERWSELGPTTADHARVYDYLYHEVPRSDRKVTVQATLLGFAPAASESEPWCGLGRTLAVGADGDIYPCSMLMTPQFRLGSVEDTSLEQAIQSPRLRQLCEDCAARKTTIEACRTCTWRNFCQAGCPASVLAEKGTLWATDDLCKLRQRLYRQTLFDLAERRQKGPPSFKEGLLFVITTGTFMGLAAQR
jgi:radical SAM protein with 4Fe4S-binding SPASM domain